MESVRISGYVHFNMLEVNYAELARNIFLIEVVVQVKTKGDLDSFRRTCISLHFTKSHPVYPIQLFPYGLKDCRSIRVSLDEEGIDLQ